MKHTIGDRVTIREDLKVGSGLGMYVNQDMVAHHGKKAVIQQVFVHRYGIDLDGGEYFWTDEMFESIYEVEPRQTPTDTEAEINSAIDYECRRIISLQDDREKSIKELGQLLKDREEVREVDLPF